MRAPPLPEGAIVNASIMVVQYLDEDGEMKFGIHHDGDVGLSQYLGLLQIATLHLYEESRDW